MDNIYIKPNNKNIFYLDCTRVTGGEIISRQSLSIDKQIHNISKIIQSEIILADDVVFSGEVVKKIIKLFEKNNIKVIGIITSISTEKAYQDFNNQLENGIRTNYLMAKKVTDQICERDFYFGIAGSGIMTKTKEGYLKAPYFKPYGNPNERASIPKEYEIEFSKGCLKRSIDLWEEIDSIKKKETLIEELPEKIINTNKKEPVVKTLKKELERL